MARQLSQRLRDALYSELTDELIVPLLTLSHPQFSESLRFALYGPTHVDFSSRSNQYMSLNFQFRLPTEDEREFTRLVLTLDNTDQRITQELEAISGQPITVLLEFVLEATPDIVEATWEGDWRLLNYTLEVVEGEVDVLPAESHQQYPSHDYSRAHGFVSLQ